MDILDKVKCPHARGIFETMFRVYAIDVVIRDLGFYIQEGVINTIAAKKSFEIKNTLIKQLAVMIPVIIESMNVPTHALYTPIAGDYIKYNEG